MKKITILSVAILLFAFSANSQVTKGNWLVGGNANFSKDKTKGPLGSSNETRFILSPDIGYFLANKFAVGVNFSLDRFDYTLNENNNHSTSYLFGPFARYYFLPTDKQVNVFAGGSYQLNIQSPGGSSTNRYSFFAGPVIFFNSSVGLEFTVNYSSLTYSGSTTNTFQIGAGFQIHLEKEKKQ